MTTRLDRLIARIVDGTHEIRAPRPAMFEDTVTDSNEWPGEIESELLLPPAIRPVPNAVTRGTVDPAPPGRRRERPTAMPIEAARAEERPAIPELPINETGRPVPVRPEVVPPRQAELPSARPRIATPSTQPGEVRQPARTPRPAVATTPRLRTPAVREHASEAHPSQARPVPVDVPAAEPDRITIEIGRIDAGGPARRPERMLTLDAYRTARRGGSR